MVNYVGKICPFCKTEILEGDSVKVCPSCGIPHHEGCWEVNGGCTTFGCSQQTYGEQNADPAQVCRNCGTPLGADQAFCPNCGTPKAPPRPTVCSNCGAPLAEGQAFCAKCGQKVGLAVDAGVSAAISQFNAGVESKKKKKTKLPIILGAVAVVIVVLLVVLLSGPSVEEIQLSKSSVELRTGDTTSVSYTITPEKAEDVDVTWKSSNESVATVSKSGKITGKGAGSCTITVTAGGKSDTVKVTVKDGPDFKALYNQYCESTWADYGSDGSYLSIDTNPYNEEDEPLAYPEAYNAIVDINEALGLPDSLLENMGHTSSADGKQTETYDEVTVTWKYHPDKGLEVTYRAN